MNKQNFLQQAQRSHMIVEQIKARQELDVVPVITRHIKTLQDAGKNLAGKLEDFALLDLPLELSWVLYDFSTIKISSMKVLLVQRGVTPEHDTFCDFPSHLIGISVWQLCYNMRLFYKENIQEVRALRKKQAVIEFEQCMSHLKKIMPHAQKTIEDIEKILQCC